MVMFFPRRGMEWGLRGADAPWLLGKMESGLRWFEGAVSGAVTGC